MRVHVAFKNYQEAREKSKNEKSRFGRGLFTVTTIRLERRFRELLYELLTGHAPELAVAFKITTTQSRTKNIF
jgi:hypothetical protein